MNTVWIRHLVTGPLVIGLLIGVLPVLVQDGDELTETFVTDDGSLSFDYPVGWYVEEFSMLPEYVLIGTSAEAVKTMGDRGGEIPSGELLIYIFGPKAAPVIFDYKSPETLEDALEILRHSGVDETWFGEPKATTLAGHSALLMEARIGDNEGVISEIDFDGHFVIAFAETVSGEYSDYANIVLAVLDTLVYTVPEGVIRYKAETVDLNFEYPADWIVFEVPETSFFMIVNKLFKGVIPGSGQMLMSIATPTTLDKLGISPAADAYMIATDFSDYWLSKLSKQEVKVIKTETVTMGENTIVKFIFASDENEGFVSVLPFEDKRLAVIVITATGELANFEADAMAVIESITYTPAD